MKYRIAGLFLICASDGVVQGVPAVPVDLREAGDRHQRQSDQHAPAQRARRERHVWGEGLGGRVADAPAASDAAGGPGDAIPEGRATGRESAAGGDGAPCEPATMTMRPIDMRDLEARPVEKTGIEIGPRIEPASALPLTESVRTEETHMESERQRNHAAYLSQLTTEEIEEVSQAAVRTLMQRRNQAGVVDQTPRKGGEAHGTTSGGVDLGGLAYERETGHHEITLDNFEHVMTYQPWMPHQREAGAVIHEALVAAGKAILRSVVRCPSRTLALQHLIDARMRANAAISHGRWVVAILGFLLLGLLAAPVQAQTQTFMVYGSTAMAVPDLPMPEDRAWEIVGSHDLTATGVPALVWINRTTQQVAVWYLRYQAEGGTSRLVVDWTTMLTNMTLVQPPFGMHWALTIVPIGPTNQTGVAQFIWRAQVN